MEKWDSLWCQVYNKPREECDGGKHKELSPVLIWNIVAPAQLGWYVTRKGQVLESLHSRYMFTAKVSL